MIRQSIILDFEKEKDKYKKLLEYLLSTITTIVEDQEIPIQDINGRVKEKNSLDKKIEFKKEKYKKLEDITDICGIRIITYFKNDVDRIAKILAENFKIDKENTIDKRKREDPEKFGYVSLHYVIELSEDRLKLDELKKFKGMKVEIQIRTVLQHAWAEIEHDLGYKSKKSIPKEVTRRFARLAGLIELADDEFTTIKEQSVVYFDDVKINIAEKENKKSIDIDVISVSSYILNDDNYRECVNRIQDYMVEPLNENISSEFNKGIIEDIITSCSLLDIHTISQLNKIVSKFKEPLIKSFNRASYRQEDGSYLGYGVGGIYNSTPLGNLLNILLVNGTTNIEDEHFSLNADTYFDKKLGIDRSEKE